MSLTFLPGSSNTTPFRQDARAPDWLVADAQEFIPSRRLDGSLGSDSDPPSLAQPYESFSPGPPANVYLEPSLNGTTFYQNGPTYQQPINYLQYAPVGPYPNNLQPYQRTVHDLFIPNDLREDIQKRSAASLQTPQNLQLPHHVESYHSLTPLDDPSRPKRSPAVFGGYQTWVYKVQSSQTGQFYVLRRVDGKMFS
jgi:PAB-dependent poly(A)-specific ribonuclease subunit 3